MNKFIIIWIGQIFSTIGSRTSMLALVIWAWNSTESATALALGSFFLTFPGIASSLVAGVAVDRFNRKWLMIIGDAISGLASVTFMLIYFSGHLQIWHLYAIFALLSPFVRLQILASETAIALLVPERHYSRAAALRAMLGYGSQIIAPALAGALYPLIGLGGILTFDLTTFVLAIAMLVSVRFPPAKPQPTSPAKPPSWTRELTFGWRYLRSRPSLATLAAIDASFWFVHDLASAVDSPMILARSRGNATVFGSVSSAAGVGGTIGAIVASLRVGPRRPIRGWWLAIIAAGSAKIVFGLGRSLWVWLPAQFVASLNFPFMASCQQSIWLSKVASDCQGRVLATIDLFRQVVGAIAMLIAGPLADWVFEPALQSGGWLAPMLGGLFGTGTGAGISLLYVLAAIAMVWVGAIARMSKSLQAVETLQRQ